tara:strand:+ start:2517 stop:4505 length:1989 start_codon:yes stop_codon:yes gene_type:complete
MNENEKINQEVDESSATPSTTEVNDNVNVELTEEEKSSDNNQIVKEDVVYEIEDENESENLDSDSDIIEKISETSETLLDYLSPDLLKIKSINFDEIDSYSTESETTKDSNLNDIYSDTFSDIKQGEIVSGMIVGVNDRDVLVDVGFKSEGIISINEFKDTPTVGDEIDVFITNLEDRKGKFVLSKEKADFLRDWSRLKKCHESGEVIKGKIMKRIKGGLVVDIGNIFAFLPGSQIDIRPVVDFNEYIDQTFEFKIVKINELRKNVVLSRKELLETDIREKRQDIISQLEVGMVLEGLVKNITDFGAFIDLGGIDGLLHITDITWGRINHPTEMLETNQKIKVKIIDFDVDNLRVSLGLKQLHPEPWKEAETKYPVSSIVEGKIVNMMNYGVFIEIEEGIEGLLHVSEMSWTRHIKHPGELFKLGDKLSTKILSLDPNEKKISLGLKQLQDNPWDTLEEKYIEGSIHKGVVQKLTQFGAFVEIQAGIDGLVHISDISWTKNIRNPKDVLSKGQEIDVKILELDVENRRLSLGIKQVEENPWLTFKEKYKTGDKYSGSVIKILDKGIIIQLEDDIEGIISLSRYPKNARWKIKKQFEIDQNIDDLIVQEVDTENKKIIFIAEFEDFEQSDDSAEKNIEIKNEPVSEKMQIPDDIIKNIVENDN